MGERWVLHPGRQEKEVKPRPKRSHCRRGHEFTPDNTCVLSSGKRSCRQCRRLSAIRCLKNKPDVVHKRQQRWIAKNPGYAQDYHLAHRDSILGRKRRWRGDNPDKIRAANRKRKAAKKSRLGLWWQFEAQVEQLLYRSQKGRCFYCGEVLDWGDRTNSPLEHMVPLSRGGTHSIDNWCLSCAGCNGRKGSKTAEEFSGSVVKVAKLVLEASVVRRGGSNPPSRTIFSQGVPCPNPTSFSNPITAPVFGGHGE